MLISIFCLILAMMFSLERSSQERKEGSLGGECWKDKEVWGDMERGGFGGKWVERKWERVSLREEVIEEEDLRKDCLDLEERERWV